MDARWGGLLAVLALVAGAWQWGWRGVVLALSVIAFWLLLQFSRSLRVMRDAGKAPIGRVANAVMLQARLQAGMPLLKVLQITGSLGQRLSEPPDESFGWTDGGGDQVHVHFRNGRVTHWTLLRAAGS